MARVPRERHSRFFIPSLFSYSQPLCGLTIRFV